MVRIQGPCFSLDASGSIADALTYSDWRRRPYVKHFARPSNPRSAAQTGHRSMMGFLQSQWSQLDATQRNTWEVLANPSNLHPYHLFVQFNLIRWTNFRLPTKADPPAGVLNYGNYWGFTVSNNLPAQILVTSRLNTVLDNWAIVIYRSLSSGFTPHPSNAVHVPVMVTTDWMTWTDAPLDPGTYYYRWTRFSTDSKYFTSATQYTGIAL